MIVKYIGKPSGNEVKAYFSGVSMLVGAWLHRTTSLENKNYIANSDNATDWENFGQKLFFFSFSHGTQHCCVKHINYFPIK